MIKLIDIGYVAGLLEGEGYFGVNKNTPRIYINQTDKDTIEKLRDIMSPSSKIGMQERKPPQQKIYRFWLYGTLAASWMMTIYPLMSHRRKEVIREVLYFWRNQHTNEYKIYEVLAAAKGITIREAIHQYQAQMNKAMGKA